MLVVLVAAGAGIWFGRRADGEARARGRAAGPHAEDAAGRRPSRITGPAAAGAPAVRDAAPRGRPRPRPRAAPRSSSTPTPAASSGRSAPHERRKIASLTKIMTATLALREVPWQSTITVDRSVTRVPLVREGLRTGEHVKAWKLFYSLLLYSGNDDANQLAISSAGYVHAFVRQMNAEARRLGLHDTHFTSPSGVRRPRQLLDAVGPRGADPLRVPEPALRPARADEADPRAVVDADELEDLRQQQLPPPRVSPAPTASRRATRTSQAGASSRPPRATAGG